MEYRKIWQKTIGVCKSTFTQNVKNWKGHKLRRDIKIHSELVIVDFSKNPKICKFPAFYVSPDHHFSVQRRRWLSTQATGPLSQATGPLWSDAGVGIGMLRGNPVLSAI